MAKKTKNKKTKKSDPLKIGVVLDGKFKTPIARLSFPSLFKPESYEGSDPKYKCTLLFDENESDLTLLKKVGKRCVKEKYSKKLPKKFTWPWRDGEEREDTVGYGEGVTFINLSSNSKPLLIDRKKKEITDEDMLYAGCYVRAIVSPFVYEVKGNKGLSFALRGVQFLKEGKAFGSRTNPDDFGDDDLSDFEDDELNDDVDDDDDDDDWGDDF